jgi:hypothetical protein
MTRVSGALRKEAWVDDPKKTPWGTQGTPAQQRDNPDRWSQAGRQNHLDARTQGDSGRTGKKTLFLSLDFEADRPFLESQQSLVRRARLAFGNGPRTVFIGEIKRKDNAGLFLKGLYDLHLP